MQKKGERRLSTVKRPIQRTLLLCSIGFMLLLSVTLAAISYHLFSTTVYSDYNEELTGAVTYVEHNIDADDLKECLATGVSSEKRDRSQALLNVLVDDLGLEYLYVVIPDPEHKLMINAISATSAAERAAGETDMLIGEQSDAYSVEELNRYYAFWNGSEIGFFEESSDYGIYYTACKPLKASTGETVALICADISSAALHARLRGMLWYSVLSSVLMIGVFGAFMIIWIRKRVTNPLLALENSAADYARKNRDKTDVRDFRFELPSINTKNEVQSLGEAIAKMAADTQSYVGEIFAAEQRIREQEAENRRLVERAEAAAKIDAIQNAMTTLLMNIPAITFSKDAATGRYLACNMAFAKAARKNSPDEVVGLRDEDLYSKETAAHFVEEDRKVLERDEPYVYGEEFVDNDGNVRQMQTTKMKFVDPNGVLCVLGTCIDITEINEIKRESIRTKEAYEKALDESVTYSNIARALAVDYAYLYYVNVRTDHFIEYSQTKGGDSLVFERRGEDFFAQSRNDAQTRLYAEDRAAFIRSFTKENVLDAIEKQGTFTSTYRLITENGPVYYSMKATKMENDDAHLIIGVNDVDAQMKYQEEFKRMEEERLTYARLTALSGDYICLYTVNPKNDRYVEYNARKDYEGLGLSKSGTDFFRRSYEESERALYDEDREKFRAAFTKENVLRSIEESKLFVLNYRLLIDEKPVYVCLKAALIEEKTGPQLIIGVSDVDAQVKREEEYAKKLSDERRKANLDALTGVKNKRAFDECEKDINRRIASGEPVRFAIVVCDVNGLKAVNDTYGHHRGDVIIKQAGKIVSDVFKDSPVFRVGGDEFVVIAQGKELETIDSLVEAIDRSNERNAQTGDVVVACGYAAFDQDESVSAVFDKADEKMYENKKKLKGD